MACLNLNQTIKDPRFQVLREWYPDHNDEYIATTLAQYWDAHPGNDDWFPTSTNDRRKFTYFMNHGKQKHLAQKTESTVSAEDVSSAYETLAWAYSPSMLQDRLDLLATYFHQYVDSLVQQEKEESGKSISRSAAIRKAGGYSGVMSRIFDSFDSFTIEDMMEDSPILESDSEAEKAQKRSAAEYRLREYKKMVGMKNLLAAQAAPVIGAKENLAVAYSGMEIDLKSVDEYEQTINHEENMDRESENSDEETVNPDADEESEGRDVEATKGDRYVDYRTLRLHETLSTKAKEMLSQIPMLDSKGNVVTDDMGYAKFLDGRQVSYALIYSLQNSTQESMLEDLKAAVDRYPFLSGVVDFIEQNPDYATTLWCNFHRVGYTYSYIKSQGNSYKVSTSNTKAQGYSLMRSAGNYMRSGFVLNQEMSLYDDNGRVLDVGRWAQVPNPDIPGRTMGAFVGKIGEIMNSLAPIANELLYVNTVEGGKTFKNVKLPEEVKNRYNEAGNINGMQLFVDENPFVISTLAKALRGIGFDVTEHQVADAAVKPLHERGLRYLGVNDTRYTEKNRLSLLYKSLASLYKRVGDLVGQPATKIYDTASAELRQINSILGLSLFDELEPRTLENKKELNTYNHASLLREVFASLRNVRNLSDDEYRSFIQNEYLRFEGYGVEGASAFGDGVRFVTGWLREVLDGNRSGFNVLTQTHFNGVEYAKMSRHQKALAIFLNWLKPQPGSGGYRAYEFPIESDYESAWDYIQAPTYRTGDRSIDLASDTERLDFERQFGSGVKPLKLGDAYNVGEDNELLTLVANEVLIEYQRILAIQERNKIDPKGKNRSVLSVYEERGMQFQIFPEMNTNGFLQRYAEAKTTSEKDNVLRLEVAQQLQKILEQDYKNIESTGMLKNKLLGKIYTGENKTAYNFYSESGEIKDLGATEKGLLQDFCLNTFYARLQAVKMVYGDLSHFSGILDFEKRNMMAHAPGSPIYTGATYQGKPLGMKENENVMYMGDESSASYFYDNIAKAIDKSTFLTSAQKAKAKRAYSDIKSTDGQGFRTLDSARELLVASDGATGTIWTEEHERAYQRIKKGKFLKRDADLFLNLSVNFQNIKPVLTGYQILDAAEGDVYEETTDENGNVQRNIVVSQKPVKTPVLHKYSEVILLPHELLGISPQMESAMYGGLSMAADKLGRKVDLYLFHSGVKVGYHDGIDPFGFVKQKDADGNETKKNLLDENGNPIRRNHTAQEVSDYIVNSAKQPRTIQSIPFKYLRIASSTGAHTKDTEISWSSQAQKNIWSNYDDNEEVSVRGRKMTLAEAHKTNTAVQVATIKNAYDSLLKEIGDLDKLEDLLQTELALKPYNSRQMRWALTRLKNGDFVSPLGNPSIMSGIEQLLLGLMKKRITRHTAKGANIIQITSLGLDHDPFNPNEAMNPNHKLGIEFDDKGNLVAIDCYISIHDTRLEQFADASGAITPERLKQLIKDGVIDENILKFIAYRTPSDDLHSILPLRIKGFVSGVGGANIIVPKEVMKMTGHDFDGDKLRCHFIEFDEVWDEGLIADDYEELTKFNPVRASEVLAIDPRALGSLEAYTRFAKSHRNPWRNEYVKISSVKYDYDKSAFENSQTARDNAQVELAYARFTSDSGSSLVFVPGGADDTSQYAKAIHLTKEAARNERLQKFLHSQGINTGNKVTLYNALINKSIDELDYLMEIANGSSTPLSFSHALDAYDYIIGGARMIDVNAMYSSAFKLFQKMNLRYHEKVYTDENGKQHRYEVRLFKHANPVHHLFDIKNSDGLSSMTYARWVNAAVDNGKDPILGLLNQVPELAEVSFFLAATNNSEEEIHLFLNQPIIIEAVKRMRESKKSLVATLEEMLPELVGDGAEKSIQKYINAGDPEKGIPGGNINVSKSLKHIAEQGRDDYIRGMVVDYNDLNKATNLDTLELQLSMIGFLVHTAPATNALANLVKLTRPESSSSGIDSTIAGTIVKWNRYYEYCKAVQEAGDEFPIEGAEIVLPLAIGEWSKDEEIEGMTDAHMGYVQVLNSLLVDGSFDVMSWFFPQARTSWRDFAIEISKMYRYRNLQKGVVKKVLQDMFLFKLMGNKGFLRDIENRRKEVLVNMPYDLKTLQIRIRRAKEAIERGEEVIDKAVIPLIGNKFLSKIEIYDPETKEELPRLKFNAGGPTIDTMSDEISMAWSELQRSSDKDIRQIGQNLFLYNIFTAGLGYGMYEFMHFAPMNVMMAVPGFMKAMNSIVRSNFRIDSVEGQRFRNQYQLNHWGDKRFLHFIDVKDIPTKGEKANPAVVEKILGSDYIVRMASDSNGNKFYDVMRVVKDDTKPFGFELELAPKLGIRGYYGQMTLHYNPEVDTPTPIQTGDDSNWHFDENSPYAEADISDEETANERASVNDQANTPENIRKRFLARRNPRAREVNERASRAVAGNQRVIEESEELTEKPLIAENGMHMYRGMIKPEPGTIFVFGSNPEGRHGAGAARVALQQFYAKYGKGEGIQGNAYAIPTKDLRVKENNSLRSIAPDKIIESIRAMYAYAERNIDKTFKVAYTNSEDETTLNGYTGREMFNMFVEAGPIPSNVQFSENWLNMANGVDPAAMQNAAQEETPAPTQDDYREPEQTSSYEEDAIARLQARFAGIRNSMKQLNIVQRVIDKDGNEVVKTVGVPVSPYGINEARRQAAYVELNRRLTELLRQKGIAVGVLSDAEELLNMNGITDFDTPKVLANGLIEMVRLTSGVNSQYALPEEFAHIAIEMVGHDQPLVRRLINALKNNDAALANAFDGGLDAYIADMGEDADREALAVEAAGKLVAKRLFQQQALKGHPFLRLINRVVDFIKSVIRRFSTRELHDAIYESERNASRIARNLIDGRLLDGLNVESIHASGQMKQLKVDITNRTGALNRILKNELKKLNILQSRKSATQRDEKTSYEVATLSQIKKLEDAIRNDKSEKAILDYFSETLNYLTDVEKDLDEIVTNPNANRSAGFVCRKLADVRDTIDCYAAIVTDMQLAIRDKELAPTKELLDAIGNMERVVSQFYQKCNRIGLEYAEKAMEGVYGKDGRTIQLGPERGKKISIHDMLTNARRDVSLATRWVHSLADSGDEVLMAIDSITKEAKEKARATMRTVTPRINKAFADYVRETGTRDQSFMFERDEHGKRTGRYISEEQVKARFGANSAQMRFYNEMMAIKHEVDKLLPPTYVAPDKIVMLRKHGLSRIGEAIMEGGNIKHEAWEFIRNGVMDTSDDVDFDNKEVTVDFLNNRVDRLIPMFCNKGKNETFDDMTDDVATSILAYAGMGYEYSEMNGVVFVLENLKYMAAMRDVQKTSGSKLMRETIGDPDPQHDTDTNYFYHRPYTVKQARTNLQKMVDDYFYMHVYGHRYAAEGNVAVFGHDTGVSKQKLANTANALATYSQMALNLQQRISNVATGATNIIIESVGGGVYNAKDVAWATKEYVKQTGDRLKDTGRIETDNYLSLFAEYFDVHQDNGRKNPNYKKGRASKVFNGSLLFAGLQIGEDYLAITTALAAARNYKVKDAQGHEHNLYEAYEVKYLDTKNKTGAFLKLKEGWTKADGSEITAKDERDFSNLVAGLNFQLQGIYNLDDKSAMQQYALGSLLIMYRKWIAPALKRRYSKPKYNILTQQEEEGYYRTLGQHIYDSMFGVDGMINASQGLIESFKLNYSKLTDYEKSNIRRALTEAGTLLATIAAIFLLEQLPPDKDDEDANKFLSWAHSQMLLSLLRERNEIGSIAPTPLFFKEVMNTLGSPFAAWRPLQRVLQGFLLLWPPSYWTPVKSGVDAGHTKAYKYLWNLPVLSMYKQIQKVIDPTPVINYYKNNIMG